MPRFLIVTHQTATSPELLHKVQALVAIDGESEFAVLVPASPQPHQFTREDLETVESARLRADAARTMLEDAGARVVRVAIGGRVPMAAIEQEIHEHPGYDGLIVCTLAPGLSGWLRTDLPHQASRRFGLPVTHVVASETPAAAMIADEASRASRALATMRDEPIESLVARLRGPRFAVRRRAREVLTARGRDAVPALAGALADHSPELRWEAARALVDIPAPEAAPALVEALADADGGTRWLAAEALVNIGDAAALPLLRALLRRSESAWLREGAHHVLHRLESGNLRTVLHPVVVALESHSPAVGVLPAVDRALRTIEGYPLAAVS